MIIRPGVVSTIITVYNRPQLLAEAVTSVLAQTYRPIEIVIVDDGSTDRTGEVGAALAASHPDEVRYLRQQNQGPAGASNAGLRVITGEFVQFLDSDDLLLPAKFTLQVGGLKARPECGVSYGAVREYVIGEAWSGLPTRRTGQAFDYLFPDVLLGRIWPSPAPLYRRAVVEINGPFTPSSIYQDWEYECRTAAQGVRLHYCAEFVADVRGTHRVEGRKKGGASGPKLQEYAAVLERILGHARRADVPARYLDSFARRLFAAARTCAAAGYEADARHCLALALSAAGAPRRKRIAAFAAMADAFGWQRVSRTVERADHGRVLTFLRAVRRQPRELYARWRHRAGEAAVTISGQPALRWPALLWHRWSHRRSKVRARV